jgi:hypothetical protein
VSCHECALGAAFELWSFTTGGVASADGKPDTSITPAIPISC